MHIPFVDLRAQYLSIQSEMDAAIASVITNTSFIGGPTVDAFEKSYSEFMGMKHTIACANGTDSLEILLVAMGIQPGDEVIVPAISWISTAEAVTTAGGVPVFVDVDEQMLIDISKIEERITNRTKAIIPVHLYGNPVDMNALMAIAEKHGLLVLEDCAQSHAATIHGKKAGTFGQAASFSFYPGKNLGAYGDAGGMVTNHDDIAKIARAIANHGQEGKHNHIREGRNSRMDGIQGAVLDTKLPHLETWTEGRRKNAHLYHSLLNENVVKPIEREGFRHVFHLYVIQHEDRNGLMAKLKEAQIDTAVHYPVPLPLMPCYTARFHHTAADYPVAARLAKRILSLPMYSELTPDQIAYVAEHVNANY
jgi:dTDP-4-amino-4,6-dideoxygalactose transaminase